ncbi:MAG TPA: class I SAM-dependent methyltransferase [Rugosimonospora sp.]|nr:class I SAM-dependent methyltransferase [Rugosimonospora sp.]
MTSATIFSPLHASWYDRWHHNKDYPAEVAQLRGVLRDQSPVDSVLDLGCGTARHLELLAESGYAVTGVDRSPTMVAAARARLARFDGRAEVVESDLLDLALDRTFDAVTMMFSVLGYQVTTEGLLAALGAAHRHLRPDGILLFDILDGVVVLRDGALGGVTVVTDGDQQLIRATTGALDVDTQVYELRMRLWLLDGGRLVEHIEESHPLRFFLARELELLLAAGGFRLLGSAPLAGGQPGPSRAWSRLVWARRL